MTVQVTTSTQPYSGNGVSTVFPIPFRWLDDSHISGTLTSSGITNPLIQGIDYTLTGVGDEGGGAATLVVAPPVGSVVQFTRSVPITQLLNLISNDGFPAETVELALDKITMILQQHQDILTGAISAPAAGLSGAISLGGTADVFKQTVGSTAQFRGITAGPNITVTTGANDITIGSVAGNGEVNTGSNLGFSGAQVFAQKIGTDLQFRTLVPGANIVISQGANDITISTPPGTGEANTGSNLGATGASVFKGKVAVDFQFRKLIAGTNVTLVENANDITINGPAAAGEINTGSNLGATGASVFKGKVGVDFQHRKIIGGLNISVTENANDITIAGLASVGEANTASNVGVTGVGLFKQKTALNLEFKGLGVGAGISQSATVFDITHAVDQAFPFTWTGAHTHNKAGSGGTTATPVFPVQINDLQNGALNGIGPIIETGNYLGSLDIRKTSLSSAAQGQGRFGNSALTVQHQVSGKATDAIANCGMRIALETTQDHSGGPGPAMGKTNDAVVLYMGLQNDGKGVGGFGIHLDGFHNPAGNAAGGQTPSTYGFSAEMWNAKGTGFVAAFHARAINDAAAYHFDIEYAFLASRGGDGAANSTYTRGLSIGSANTGTVKTGVAIDTTYAIASAQSIYMAQDQEVGWSGTQHSLAAATDTRCVTRWSSAAQEFQLRNGGSNRISFPTAVGATYLFDFATGSRWFSGAFTPTFVGAIKVLADGGGTLYIPVCNNHP